MSPKRNLVKAVVAAGLTVALTSGIALASIGTGTVTASSLRLRSEATSNDYATTADVLMEVLDQYSAIGKTFDWFCCLYPTAPFASVSSA